MNTTYLAVGGAAALLALLALSGSGSEDAADGGTLGGDGPPLPDDGTPTGDTATESEVTPSGLPRVRVALASIDPSKISGSLTARERAEVQFDDERSQIEDALTARFNDAAKRKGFSSGWPNSNVSFSQAEVWWVTTHALGDLEARRLERIAAESGQPGEGPPSRPIFDPAIARGIQDWAREVDTARGVVTQRGWLTGQAMSLAMAMARARTQPVGVLKPDWTLFA